MRSIVLIVHCQITLVVMIHCLRSKLLCLQRIEFYSLLISIPRTIKTSYSLLLIKISNLCIQSLNKLSFFELIYHILPLRPFRWGHRHLILLFNIYIYSLQRIFLAAARCWCAEARWWGFPSLVALCCRCGSSAHLELMQNIRDRVLRVQALSTHWITSVVLV